ncbi:hypothetical protein HVTV-2_gp99 [Haloarcula virus HVTV-2]|nr:hypothetical protein HVTV-2_gp99 [Haloarcula virus HVTV-2]
MTQEQVKTFETTDEAVSFLYDNPDFDGDLRVLEREGDPEPRDLSDAEETSYNPDLPVKDNDPTHRYLYLLSKHEANAPERMLSSVDILDLTAGDSFAPGPAAAALLKAGYANERKEGRRSYYYITEEGERLLDNLGEPASEVTGDDVLGF